MKPKPLPTSFPFQAPQVVPSQVRCQTCMRLLEPSEFVIEADNVPHVSCRACERVRAGTAQNKINAEEKGREVAIKTFIAQLQGKRIDAPHISELAAEMIKRFGGIEEFSVSYFSQLQAAIGRGAGSVVVLRAHDAISRLVALSTQHRASAPDVSDMTAEEIELELAKLAPHVFRPEEEEAQEQQEHVA